MSQDNFLRFMMLTDLDSDVKKQYDSIIEKYQSQKTEQGRDKIIVEELIPLAKETGFAFSLEDMKQAKTVSDTLSDDALEKVDGGRGEWSETITTRGLWAMETYTLTYFCELAPNNAIFIQRYKSFSNNCPDFEYISSGPKDYCKNCKHYHVYRSDS